MTFLRTNAKFNFRHFKGDFRNSEGQLTIHTKNFRNPRLGKQVIWSFLFSQTAYDRIKPLGDRIFA